jgi:hypothetical protein
VKSAAGHPIKLALYEKGVKAPGKDGEIWGITLNPPTEWREVRILFSQLEKRGTFQPADQDNNNILNTDRIAALHIDHVGTESDAIYLKNIRLTKSRRSNPPGKPLPPSGPDRAFWQTPVSYTASALDPDGDQVKYIFDWGDGVNGETDFYFSGAPVKLAHTWSLTGGCKLRVKAIDSQGLASEWSDPKQISIALNDTVFEDFEEIGDVWSWPAKGGTLLIDSTEGPTGRALRVKYRCPTGSPQDTGVFKMATSINDSNWSGLTGLRFNFKATTPKKFYVVLLEGSKTEPEKTSEQWIFELTPEKEWTLVEIPFSAMEKILGAAVQDNQANDTMDLDKIHYISFHPSPGSRGTFFINALYLTTSAPGAEQDPGQ